jgi:hypothetical protein
VKNLQRVALLGGVRRLVGLPFRAPSADRARARRPAAACRLRCRPGPGLLRRGRRSGRARWRRGRLANGARCRAGRTRGLCGVRWRRRVRERPRTRWGTAARSHGDGHHVHGLAPQGRARHAGARGPPADVWDWTGCAAARAVEECEGGWLGYCLRCEKWRDHCLFTEWGWAESPHTVPCSLRALDREPPKGGRCLLAWLAEREAEHKVMLPNLVLAEPEVDPRVGDEDFPSRRKQ